MKYIIKVHVQLPDGKFAYCPAVRNTANGPEVVKHNSTKEAHDWADIILSTKSIVAEDK